MQRHRVREGVKEGENEVRPAFHYGSWRVDTYCWYREQTGAIRGGPRGAGRQDSQHCLVVVRCHPQPHAGCAFVSVRGSGDGGGGPSAWDIWIMLQRGCMKRGRWWVGAGGDCDGRGIDLDFSSHGVDKRWVSCWHLWSEKTSVL
jgi:hypothetical protein